MRQAVLLMHLHKRHAGGRSHLDRLESESRRAIGVRELGYVTVTIPEPSGVARIVIHSFAAYRLYCNWIDPSLT
jgi:hypothetical protein